MDDLIAPSENYALEDHLKRENPLLLEPLEQFRQLDRVAGGLGLLDSGESFTRHVPWWPVISFLGTYSAGKSTFINRYLGIDLQRTGNQAVDDRFTVICYSDDDAPRTLPGSALDGDPRFPFYGISRDINGVVAGEGRRINNYLQLAACNAEQVRGKILLDSPGFDSDSQRSATLRITDRIIDLSDLVLVFFDARHPEPGAMRDTLKHLVTDTIQRADAAKFLFILNQIDVTAREDNPEDVVAAWQRALASSGLTAGRFLRIYDEAVAVPITNPALATRFKTKKDEDLAELHRRIHTVEVDRLYRILELSTDAANALGGAPVLGQLRQWLRRWRNRTLLYDALLLAPALAALAAALVWANVATAKVLSLFGSGTALGWLLVGIVVVLALLVHFAMRGVAARHIGAAIPPESEQPFQLNLRRAFQRNTNWWRSVFWPRPAGWGGAQRQRLLRVVNNRERMIQRLNDYFTHPTKQEAKPAM